MNVLHRYLISCAMAGCVTVQAAPFLAIGDNAELFVTATTGVRYEDNTLLTENNTVDDVVLQFVPGIELIFGKNSLYSGSFVAQESITHYLDNDSIDSNLESFFFKSDYAFSRLSMSLDASYKMLEQNSRDVTNAATLTRRDTYDVSFNGEYGLTEKIKFGSGVSYSNTNYKTAGFNDSKSYTVPVNLYYAITPKVDLSIGVRHHETIIESAPDFKDDYYNIGARGEFTPKLSGHFSVGFTDRQPEAGKSSSLIGMDFDLSYAFSPKTNFTFNASNDFSASSVGGTSQEVLSFTFGGTTQITSQLSTSASVTFQQADYTPGGRSDDFIVFNISASYAFNQHISTSLTYNFQQNDSSLAGASFTANVISLNASFRY